MTTSDSPENPTSATVTSPRSLEELAEENKAQESAFTDDFNAWQAGKMSDDDFAAKADEHAKKYQTNAFEAFVVAAQQHVTVTTPTVPTVIVSKPVAVAESVPEETVALPVVPQQEEDHIQQHIFDFEPKVGESRNIVAIKVPKEMENNISMGHEKMDILMAGDGATPSTACLVTGVPGAGKSTMMFQLADAITGAGHIALYNTCEESLVQVSRVAKRLRLRHGFNVAAHRSVFDVVEHTRIFQKENPDRQVFLFVDSLQTIEVPNYEYDEEGSVIKDPAGEPVKRKGRPASGQTTQVEVTKILTSWCKKTYGIMFLIGQVNKDGDFAGRQAIKHWVDAHLHLDINRDRYSGDYGSRTAEMTKNRFGVAGIYYPFEIEARGIKFTEPKAQKP